MYANECICFNTKVLEFALKLIVTLTFIHIMIYIPYLMKLGVELYLMY